MVWSRSQSIIGAVVKPHVYEDRVLVYLGKWLRCLVLEANKQTAVVL